MDKDFIDKKIRTIPIKRVCEALNLDRKHRRYRCVNPLHPDKDPSMTVYEKSNTWYCFACGEHGSVIDMVKLACKCNFIDACEWLAHNFGILLPDKSNWRNTSRNVKPVKKASQIKSETKAPNIDHELLEWIVTNGGISNLAKSFLYDERKLSEEVISECRIFSLNDEYRFISKLVSVSYYMTVRKCGEPELTLWPYSKTRDYGHIKKVLRGQDPGLQQIQARENAGTILPGRGYRL